MVVSVMIILMSLLLPALRKSMAVGKRIACANNFRQLGLAESMYTQDHDGMITFEYIASPFGAWYTEIRPYFGKATDSTSGRIDTLVCPADPANGTNYQHDPSEIWWAARSTGINYSVKSKRMGSISKPSTAIFFAEVNIKLYNTNSVSAGTTEKIPDFWHNLNINLLFIDGHVNLVKVSNLYPGGTLASYWTP